MPTQWQGQTTVWGTLRLPEGWSVNKARTGDGDIKYLLSNQTIDVIADSWKEP